MGARLQFNEYSGIYEDILAVDRKQLEIALASHPGGIHPIAQSQECQISARMISARRCDSWNFQDSRELDKFLSTEPTCRKTKRYNRIRSPLGLQRRLIQSPMSTGCISVRLLMIQTIYAILNGCNCTRQLRISLSTPRTWTGKCTRRTLTVSWISARIPKSVGALSAR